MNERVRQLEIFLTDPSEDAGGIVVEHEGEGLRAGAHEDGVAEVGVEPILTTGFDLLFARGKVVFLQGGREGGGGEVEMDCFARGVLGAEFADDEHAPVASLDGVAGVGQSVHEGVEDAGGVEEGPAAVGRWRRPHEAGNGGGDDVERGRVRVSGVCKRSYNTVEFVEAAWPAVYAEEGDGGWIG